MSKWKFGPLMGWKRLKRHFHPFVIDTPISQCCIQSFGISLRLAGRRSTLSLGWPNWTSRPGWRIKQYGIYKTLVRWLREWKLYVSFYSTPWSAAYWHGRALFIGYENGRWRFLPNAEARAYAQQGVSYLEYAVMDEGDGQIDAFRELCKILRENGVEQFEVDTYWGKSYPVPLIAPKEKY